jgi:hypothetical protein
MRIQLPALAAMILAAGIGAAQTPAPQAPAAASPAEQAQGFTYNAEGRRDPFVSLLRRGGDSGSPLGQRPAGLPGLLTSEVTLRGVVQGQNGFVGMLLGSDQRTYIVRPGDRLFDGVVKSISANALIITQQVNDPLSLEKQRDVRKALRQTDEAQQ